MTSQEQIQVYQKKFLNRYNYERNNEIALTSALKAATQRNTLYTPQIDRTLIRSYWKQQLVSIGEKYVTKQSESIFINDVKCLKCRMNQRFEGCFDNNSGKYDKGFRISHAQKSLSVYLKHLWCMGKIAIPPVCPIDRRILSSVKAPNTNWCYVNDIDDYKQQLKYVKYGKNVGKKNDDPLAVWELLAFQNI